MIERESEKVFLRDGLLDGMLNASTRNVETSYISLSNKCDKGVPNAFDMGSSPPSSINPSVGGPASQWC